MTDEPQEGIYTSEQKVYNPDGEPMMGRTASFPRESLAQNSAARFLAMYGPGLVAYNALSDEPVPDHLDAIRRAYVNVVAPDGTVLLSTYLIDQRALEAVPEAAPLGVAMPYDDFKHSNEQCWYYKTGYEDMRDAIIEHMDPDDEDIAESAIMVNAIKRAGPNAQFLNAFMDYTSGYGDRADSLLAMYTAMREAQPGQDIGRMRDAFGNDSAFDAFEARATAND